MKHAWLALCLLMLALVAPPALAAPSVEERERARASMDQGDARFEAKDYAAALEHYRAADRIMGVPTTGIEVGRTLERLGRLLEAREMLRRVSEYPPRADEPRPFANARQRADRLLGDIAPRIPRVTLEVVGLPDGVAPELTWDGQVIEAGRIGGYLEADPGVHHVVGNAPGFPPITREVRLAEGQALAVTLQFGAAQSASSAPPTRRGEPIPSRPPRRRPPALLWVGVGVAGAGIVAGSIAGVRSLSLASSAKQHCDGNACSAAAQADIDDAKTWANVSNVGFGVAAVGLCVSAWQWLAYRSEQRGKPGVSVGLGQVAVMGTF